MKFENDKKHEMNSLGNKISKEYINVFERFDRDYDGFIPIDDISEIMKKAGRPISEGELQDVKGEIYPNDNSIFDLKECMRIIGKRSREKKAILTY